MIGSVVLAAADSTLAKPIAKAMPPNTRLHILEVTPATQVPSIDDLPADICLVLVQLNEVEILEPWLRRLFDSGVPVIAIISDPNDRDRVFRAGVRDYILEPLVVSEVQARIVPYLQNVKPDRKGVAAVSPGEALLERLDQQWIQNERWIAMGRVVAAICHDITNRMQAAQGALTLAAEEPSLSADMQAYLELSMQEARRVTAYMQRLRRVYHPETDTFETIDVHRLLSEVRDLTSDTTVSGAVSVETFVAPNLSPLRCKAGQLEFILLGILLNLMDLVSTDSPACIRMEASPWGSATCFEISTNSRLADWVQARKDNQVLEHALGLSGFRAVLAAQNGKLGFSCGDSGLKIWISLPMLPTIS